MRRLRSTILPALLLCFLVLVGCAPKKVSNDDLTLGPLRLNMSPREVESLLGRPASDETILENVTCWQYVVDEQIRLVVLMDTRGIYAVGLEQVQEGRLPQFEMEAARGAPVQFADESLATTRGMTVGDDADRVLAQYGKPQSDSSVGSIRTIRYVYRDEENGQSDIVFNMEAGRVTCLSIGRTNNDASGGD